MNDISAFFGDILSSTAAIGIVTFIFKESFSRMIDLKLELLKSQLRVGEKRSELVLRSHIEHKERQLAEFYGPIYSRLKRGRPIYDFWSEGRLEEIESSVIDMFIEHNNTIVDILITKSHLIEGARIPESHIHFLSHVVIWHAYHNTKHGGVPFTQEEFPYAYMSDSFENEIITTTEALKADLDRLHKEYGLLVKEVTSTNIPS